MFKANSQMNIKLVNYDVTFSKVSAWLKDTYV